MNSSFLTVFPVDVVKVVADEISLLALPDDVLAHHLLGGRQPGGHPPQPGQRLLQGGLAVGQQWLQ